QRTNFCTRQEPRQRRRSASRHRAKARGGHPRRAFRQPRSRGAASLSVAAGEAAAQASLRFRRARAAHQRAFALHRRDARRSNSRRACAAALRRVGRCEALARAARRPQRDRPPAGLLAGGAGVSRRSLESFMHDLINALILGVVEGLTEFLPISSTGHLILASDLLGATDERWKVFNIVIQTGAMLAVVWEYRARFFRADFALYRNLAVAFIPAAVLGLAFSKYIKAHLFHAVPVALAFIVGGFIILAVDRGERPHRVANT